jgi:NAD(P)-dependent dehydrogenase (short-subunit alcohol dehydrogenase family)
MHEKKIVIVTGAARGIGYAIANRLIADGWFVVAVDVDSQQGEVIQSLLSPQLEFYHADISRSEDVGYLFTNVIGNYGRVDAVVNNAGIIRDNMIWKMSEEDFDAVINVNLKGTWLMCREAAVIMKEQNYGKIVNIASRASLGNKGQSNYSASKAGVVALSRVLALELGKFNVAVNTVSPGLIETPLTEGLEKHVLQKLIDAQPTHCMGLPEDVANAVSFLISDQTRFITGQTIYVDGGKSIGANV